jgi:hypothetical protein
MKSRPRQSIRFNASLIRGSNGADTDESLSVGRHFWISMSERRVSNDIRRGPVDFSGSRGVID